MEDIELVQLASRGDGGAIRMLYDRHAPRVFAVVRRLAGDDTLAEDWAQEAWMRVIRALPSFRGDSQFSTWLHRVAVNSALHGRRSRERKTGRETVMDEEVAVRPAGGGDALLRLRLERAMKRLPEGMRRVLVLHDVEGYTHEEIGEMLGVNPGTCKSQLFKARARMRSLLAPVPEYVEEVQTCHT
jgi:RNA polymerase sigma-70 factor (ECF subfamily)